MKKILFALITLCLLVSCTDKSVYKVRTNMLIRNPYSKQYVVLSSVYILKVDTLYHVGDTLWDYTDKYVIIP